MIIDAHTHIGSFGKGPVHTPKQLLSSMDKAGISLSLIIANWSHGMGAVENVINVAQSSKRFRAIGFVDHKRIGKAHFAELQRFLIKGLICGVKIYPGYSPMAPSDRRLYPLYAFCEKNGFPIIVHTGVFAQELPGLLRYAHPLHIDEIAARFPKLKIVMAHFGNPWIMDAAAVVAKNENVYIDVSGYFTEYAHISLKETKEFVDDLKRFQSFVGSFRRCLFGTDWWLYEQKEYLKAVKTLPLTKEEQELVFWKNANDIFKLGLKG